MDNHKVIAIEDLIKNNESIVTSVQELSEDEKKELLRKSDFVNKLSSFQLEAIINSLNFMDAFNMLQNKTLLDKIKHVNVKLKAKDAMFVKDFISLIPISMIHHIMLFNMLKTLSKDDVIEYIKDSNILEHLNKENLIELAVLKRINLFNVFDHNILDNELSFEYINRYFKSTMDFNIINNPLAKKVLFNDEDIELDNTIYLYTYLTTQNNHSIKEINHSLEAFIEVNRIYEELGLEKTIDKFNTKGIVIEDVFKFKSKKKTKTKGTIIKGEFKTNKQKKVS